LLQKFGMRHRGSAQQRVSNRTSHRQSVLVKRRNHQIGQAICRHASRAQHGDNAVDGAFVQLFDQPLYRGFNQADLQRFNPL
jgi:hypothetical protein